MNKPTVDEFVDQVRRLTDELNMDARTAMKFDPLYSVDFSCNVALQPGVKESMSPMHITVSAVYSSGHGGESAHVLSRTASFRVTGAMITDIRLTDCESENQDDVTMDGHAEREFLQKLRRFFKDLLPSPCQ